MPVYEFDRVPESTLNDAIEQFYTEVTDRLPEYSVTVDVHNSQAIFTSLPTLNVLQDILYELIEEYHDGDTNMIIEVEYTLSRPIQLKQHVIDEVWDYGFDTYTQFIEDNIETVCTNEAIHRIGSTLLITNFIYLDSLEDSFYEKVGDIRHEVKSGEREDYTVEVTESFMNDISDTMTTLQTTE